MSLAMSGHPLIVIVLMVVTLVQVVLALIEHQAAPHYYCYFVWLSIQLQLKQKHETRKDLVSKKEIDLQEKNGMMKTKRKSKYNGKAEETKKR